MTVFFYDQKNIFKKSCKVLYFCFRIIIIIIVKYLTSTEEENKMKKTEMRIVGLTSDNMTVFVQKKTRCGWVQEKMTRGEFLDMMGKEFPEYMDEYRNSNTTRDIMDYFYYYGEDGQTTYIFK